MASSNMDFTILCRTCKAEAVELTPIFTTTSPPIEKMLMAIIPFKLVQDDGLPTQICKQCLATLHSCFEFRQQVIQNYRELRTILLQNNSDNEDLNVLNQDLDTFMRSLSVRPLTQEKLPADSDAAGKSNDFHRLKTENIDLYEDYSRVVNHRLNVQNTSGHSATSGLSNNANINFHKENQNFEVNPLNSIEVTVEVDLPQSSFDPDDFSESDNDIHYPEVEIKPTVTKRGRGRPRKNETINKSAVQQEESAKNDNIDEKSVKQCKIRVFTCNLCEFTCTKHLKRHLATHLMEKPLACLKCYRTFARNDKLLRHERVCTGKRVLHCEACNKIFETEEELQQHLNAESESEKCPKMSKRAKMITLEEYNDPKELSKFYSERLYFGTNNIEDLRLNSEINHKSEVIVRSVLGTKKSEATQDNVADESEVNKDCMDKSSEVNTDLQNDYRESPVLSDSDEDAFDNNQSDDDYSPNKPSPGKIKRKVGRPRSTRGPGRPKKLKVEVNNLNEEENVTKAENVEEKDAKPGRKRVYSCNLCDFIGTNHIKRHMATHLMEKPLACGKCGRTFARNDKVLRHERICTGKRVLQCEACNKSFDNEEELQQHLNADDESEKCPGSKRSKMITLEDYNDPELLKKFYRESVNLDDYLRLKGRKSEVNKDEQSEVKDGEVNSDFDIVDDVSQSDDDYTPKTKVKRKRKVGRPKKLTPAVVEEEEPEGHYPCPVCSEEFKRMTELEAHGKEVHVDYQVLKCPQCDARFTRVYAVKRHMKYHDVDSAEKNAEKTHACEVCPRKFTTDKALKFHMRKHDADNAFVCSKCGKSFGSKSNLVEHMKFHAPERKFLCSICGLGFIRNDYLIIHMRRHRGDKPYSCKFCGKGFARQTDVKVHERYHTGEKTHLCMVCGRGFARAYSLNVHMRTHTGEKPYQCQYCSAAFAQSNDLKSHIRRHTGERFQCDLCPLNFIMGYELIQHKRKDHGLNIVSHIRRIKDSEATQDGEEPEMVRLPKPVVTRPPVDLDETLVKS